VSLSEFAQETETFFRDFLDDFLLEFLAKRLLRIEPFVALDAVTEVLRGSVVSFTVFMMMRILFT
jgi:hypothetical protein